MAPLVRGQQIDVTVEYERRIYNAEAETLLDLIRERVGVPLELEYELWPEHLGG